MSQYWMNKIKCHHAALVVFSDDGRDELRGLVSTLGLRVVETHVVALRRKDPAFFITKGHLTRIQQEAKKNKTDVVVIDEELSAAQCRNLEEFLTCAVLDRTEVILRIFADHAKTSQAKLQIEVALLRYMKPRLRQLWTHFGRIRGGISGRGGLGEQQLEIDRRRVTDRIHQIERKIKRITQKTDQQIQSREHCFKVALVGYTNVGKSTLLNHLTGADVLVDDKLFATLDTVTRRLKNMSEIPIVLSDTVGFIRRLPHHLVASFYATLAEARCADLLLIVVDAYAQNWTESYHVIQDTLASMGQKKTPFFLVFNKMDLFKSAKRVQELHEQYPQAFFVSAVRQKGIQKLVKMIVAEAKKRYTQVDVHLHYREAHWLDYFKQHGALKSLRYTPDGIKFSTMLSIPALNHFYQNRKSQT